MWENKIVEYREIAVKELKANPKNWRRHPKTQQEALSGILGEVGVIQNVILNRRTGHLIDGHLRVELAAKEGQKTLPVSVVDLSDEEENLALATLDPVSAMATRDDEMLRELLESVNLENDLINQLKNDVYALPTNEEFDAKPQIDRSEELREVWKVEKGQLWELGDHLLLCGDSTKAEDVERLFGKARASIIVTDPPYGVSYAAKNEFLNAISPANRIQTPIEGDHQTPDEMSAFWIAAFTAIRESLSPGASYYITGPQGGDLLLLLLLALRQSGFPLRHMLVWVKNNHVLGRCDYHYRHEPILYGWVDGPHRFYGDASQFSTWEIDKPNKSDLHPTMKPVELYLRAISNSSKVGDVVAEPFCGSGTSLIACEQLGRKCRAIEIDPGYVAVALQRFKDATGKAPNLLTEDGDCPENQS